MSVAEWDALPLARRQAVNAQLMEIGQEPRVSRWGPYEDDLPTIYDMRKRAHEDFLHLKRYFMRQLTDRATLEKGPAQVTMVRQKIHEQYNLDSERAKMGAWLAGYLDDAGYDMWVRYPDVFKAMCAQQESSRAAARVFCRFTARAARQVRHRLPAARAARRPRVADGDGRAVRAAPHPAAAGPRPAHRLVAPSARRAERRRCHAPPRRLLSSGGRQLPSCGHFTPIHTRAASAPPVTPRVQEA